ncbi:c-type cytochrome biogenesis protein CcsB [Mobilicoccus sp.]|uniref:c-type cytochrome biogenesis protein CcsB n=1 Tax=Mobilicoccus sp. TaxID=2034349 RepID=UPI0028AEEA86|nr:c-type cytochrome biogenesis protein CcsB [Mobilicoccus sp.]
MFAIGQYLLVAATLLTIVALLTSIVGFARRHEHAAARAGVPVAAGSAGGTGGSVLTVERPAVDTIGHGAGSGEVTGLVWYASRMVWIALACLTGSLVARVLVTGHGPFTNQHEFATSFAWGVLVAYVWFEWRYRVRTLSLAVLPVAAGMLLYALAQPSEVKPLIPALQNNLLLTLHIATAVLAYGGAAVSFAAAVLYLIRPKVAWRGLPSRDLLDEIGYRGAIFTYPMLTAMLVLGAIWADIAWGRYWSWDPKETASLVIWLIYSAYLHARVVRDWRGDRAAWLLIAGFAAVLFTFFGNHFFTGMHAYG